MKFPNERELREVAILIAQNVIDTSRLIAEGQLPHHLEKSQPDFKDPNNRTLAIDQYARSFALTALKLNFGDNIVIYGEEEEDQPGKHFAELNKVVAIIDPVDGTDLLARDFSNWVSAMIFFIPKQKQIISAVIGHASGDIYYASEVGAFIRPRAAAKAKKKNRDRKLLCNSEKIIKLCNSALCFYGQKPKNFLSMAEHKGFLAAMQELKERMAEKKDPVSGKVTKAKEALEIRIYNFGGNPMMVRIPSGAVDAVFSLGNTELHDVMPGAYIAIQAGAVFTDLAGKVINPIDALLTPKIPLRYILSGSKSLSKELVNILSKTT
jgi:fructose-1,6-bisphosphatase/inositol monophosphatase family enzyme